MLFRFFFLRSNQKGHKAQIKVVEPLFDLYLGPGFTVSILDLTFTLSPFLTLKIFWHMERLEIFQPSKSRIENISPKFCFKKE